MFGTAHTATPTPLPVGRGGPSVLRSRRPRYAPATGLIGSAIFLMVAGTLTAPSSAQAKIPIVGEVPLVGEALEGIGSVGKAILHPADAVLAALLKVLQAIFGGVEAKLITGVINGLLAVPNFNSGHVAQLEHTTVAIAAGMLSAVLTLSIIRYYVAGLADSGSGGFEALQGILRVTAAVGFIMLWGGIFNEVVQFPKMFDGALLGSGSVQHNVALLFDAALVLGATAFAVDAGLGLIFVIVIAFIAAIVFIALLWMKVLLSVLMMFLFVTMPLCVALWPVPELGWLAAAALRATFVGLLVPCVWAILFALSSAVNTDVLTWAPSHSPIDTIIVRPLAGITLMLLCITIPRFLMRTAMIGIGGKSGGGRVWRTVTFGMFAVRGAAGAGQAVASAAVEGNATARRMIDSLPAPVRPPSQPGEGTLASRMVFGRTGFTEDENHGGKSKKSPSTDGKTQSDGTSGKAQADETIRHQEAGFSVPGIKRPAYDKGAIDKAWQGMHAAAQLSPPNVKAVASAMGQFAGDTQRGIAAYQRKHPSKMRSWAAHHLNAQGLSEDQQRALFTLGSAPKAALESGIGQAIRVLDAQNETQAANTAPKDGSAPLSPQHATPAEQSPKSPPPKTASPGRSTDTQASQRQRTAPQPPSGDSRTIGGPLEQPPSSTDAERSPNRPPDPEPFLD